MNITISKKISRDRKKFCYTLKWGKQPHKEKHWICLPMYVVKAKQKKNHNRQAFTLPHVQRSQLVIESLSTGTSLIPINMFEKMIGCLNH